jgi:hypothetical protein
MTPQLLIRLELQLWTFRFIVYCNDLKILSQAEITSGQQWGLYKNDTHGIGVGSVEHLPRLSESGLNS